MGQIQQLHSAIYGVSSPLSGPALALRWLNPLHLSHRALEQLIRRHGAVVTGQTLDLGCGTRPYRSLFAGITLDVGFDVRDISGADIWGDGQRLPFADKSFDSVICNQVLEHVPEPSLLISEIQRVLRPGGVLFLTTPQTWGLHHEPHDYFRYTKYGLAQLSQQAHLQVDTIAPSSGIWVTTAQRIADVVMNTYLHGARFPLYHLAGALLAPVLIVGALLEWLFGRRGDTLDNLLIARRPL